MTNVHCATRKGRITNLAIHITTYKNREEKEKGALNEVEDRKWCMKLEIGQLGRQLGSILTCLII